MATNVQGEERKSNAMLAKNMDQEAEIARLRADRDRLREALERTDHHELCASIQSVSDKIEGIQKPCNCGRAALEGDDA